MPGKHRIRDVPDSVAVTDASAHPRLTLVGKPGCHLCDTARDVLSRLSKETGAGLVELNILDDADLLEEYAEMIPVILLDGKMHGYFRVEEERLRRDLSARTVS